ncbi:acryloyl-CoA reductase [Salinicoccus hispanicus]|uniref:Acryloyl-CoA reductase n=1 Tax=Salinicoccus hispanicus TaxID=157225 RepID=A0A6N8U121_9STAP|nr:acryloyl-CoA reductase [Salinicoccus hispanicus]MXQ50636.1 acryloyl-CoA reductase [Salinicoccus hispanicus]
MEKFRALVVDKKDEETTMDIREIGMDDLSEGEVTIKVAYSSVNYKDGMVAVKGSIAETFPIIPGIDLAGTVMSSEDDRFKEGDEVIATSYHIGTRHSGGFSEVARVPSEWVVPLPEGLSLKESMELGTAGFTAALCIQRLEENGLEPGPGKVLVDGASGGVGSLAINMLADRGYSVVASTGRTEEAEYLKSLGADTVIHRDEVTDEDGKSTRKRQWKAAVDPVGGKTLQYILSSLDYGGSVATCGLAGGIEVETTVLPFISRGINWLGIDSVKYPMEHRLKVWDRLADDLKPSALETHIAYEATLEELPDTLNDILKGHVRGRVIVKF